MAGEIKINGLEQAIKLLDGLPLQMQADALNSVHSAGARKFIIKPAQNVDPLFKTAWGISKDKEDPLAILAGARVGSSIKSVDIATRKKSKVSNKVLLWREYGSDGRKTKSGRSTGVFPKKPFFRSIVARGTRPMITFVNDNYGKIIGRYIKRQIKKL